jgi:hypothetical protein
MAAKDEVKEAQDAYLSAVRNMSSAAICAIEANPRSTPEDDDLIKHAKACLARLAELGHGVIDLRPYRH